MLLWSLLCGGALGLVYDMMHCLLRHSQSRSIPIVKRWREWLGRRARMQDPTAHPKREKATAVQSAIALFSLDVLFCLLWAVVIAVLLYYANDGQLRISAIAVAVVGFALYRCTISRVVRPALLLLRVTLEAVLSWGVAILTAPLRRLWRLVRSWITPLVKRWIKVARRRAADLKQWAGSLRLRRKSSKETEDEDTPPSLAERIRQAENITGGFVSGRSLKKVK